MALHDQALRALDGGDLRDGDADDDEDVAAARAERGRAGSHREVHDGGGERDDAAARHKSLNLAATRSILPSRSVSIAV